MIPQASLASAPTFRPGLRTVPTPANHSTAGQPSSRRQNTPALPNQPPAMRGISQATVVVAQNDGASAVSSKSTSFQPPLSQNATSLGMRRPSTTPRNTVVVDNRGFQQQASSQTRGRTVTPEHHIPGFDHLPKHSYTDNAPTKNPLPFKITLASSPQSTCSPSTGAGANHSNSNPSNGMDVDSKTRVQDAVAQTDGRDDVVAQADGWKLGDITLVDQTPPQFCYPPSEPPTSSLYQTPSTSSSALSSSGNRTPPMILRDNIPASSATFRALQSRLLASLLAMTPPDTRTALLHVQSANNYSATALAAAHRAHTLAQQSLASAQESMLAAQGCLKSAEQAHGHVNDALGAVEQINFGGGIEKNNKWEWKELVSEFKSDLHALSEWVGEKEAQETRIKPTMEKKRATQATEQHLKRAIQISPIVSNETATFSCALMDVDPDTSNTSPPAVAGVGSNTAGQAWKPEREPIAELNSIPGEHEPPSLKEHRTSVDTNAAGSQSPTSQSADNHGRNRRPEQNLPPPAMDVRASSDNPSQGKNDGQPEPYQSITQAEPPETGKIPQTLAEDCSLSETAKEVSDEPNITAVEDQAFAEEARQAALREAQAQRRQEIAEEKNRANAEAAAQILANRAKEKSLKARTTSILPVRPRADEPIIPAVLGRAQASSTALGSAPERTKVKAKKKKAQKTAHNNAPTMDDTSGSDIVPPPLNRLPSGGGPASPGADHYAPPTSRTDRDTRSTLPHDVPASGLLAANTQPPRGPERAVLPPTMHAPDIERHKRIVREQVRIDSPGHTNEAVNMPRRVKQEMMNDNPVNWNQRDFAGSPPTDFDRLHSSTSMSRMNPNPVSSPKAYYPASNQHEFFDSAESSSLSSSNFDVDPNPRFNHEFGYYTSDNTRFYPPTNKKEIFSKAKASNARESTISYPSMMNEPAPNQRHSAQRDWRPSPPRSLTPNPYFASVPTQPAGQKRYRDLEDDFEQLPLSRRPRLDGPMRPRSPSPRGIQAQSGWSIPGRRPRTPEISPLVNRLAPRDPGLPPVGRGDSYRPDYPSSLPRRSYIEPQPLPPAPATRQRQSPSESRTDLIDRFSRPPPAINPRTPVSTPRVRARRGARGGGSTTLEQRISSKSLANRLDGDADAYF